MLILHPSGRRFELLRNIGGRLLPVSGDPGGVLRCEALEVALTTVAQRLRLTWADGSTEI